MNDDPATAPISFGSWLKQHRRESGITRDELAERTVCSSITLQKIEAGERRPSRQLALLLAALFHIPSDEHEAFVAFARTSAGGQTHATGDAPTLRHSAGLAAVPLAAAAPPEGQHSRPGPGHAPPKEQAPWRAAQLRHSNVPQALSAFIGRAPEEQAIRALLLQPQVRLLTLTGTPGIGKTRLALEVAAGSIVAEHFDDGVCLVELAPVTTPNLVVLAIARALGLKESGGPQETLAAQLHHYLRDKRLLLVLDNFEQVLDAAPEVVQLLQASPWLKVLVTSREALHVKGERRFPVPPLGLPDMAGPRDRAALAHSPAVAFFVERAQDAQPDFELTEENADDVAVVCAGLDGLPLAIELAAARANLLSTRQMREALDRRLKLSNWGTRDLPARHQTLRRAIDWSYDLLEAGEQQLFRRIAVFVGGGTLAAIIQVCNADGTLKRDGRAGMESLLSKSLVQPKAGEPHALRFVMLETIQEYAREKLEESGESTTLQRAHALYFMRLAEEAEAPLLGARQAEWLSLLEKEHDNLSAALRWAREAGEQGAAESIEIGLRTAGAMHRFWYVRGYLSEGRAESDRLLAADAHLRQHGSSAPFKQSRAKTLNGVGRLALDQGDHPVARAALEEALALGRELGDKQSMALSLNSLAGVLLVGDDYVAAHALLEESLRLRREIRDMRGIALSLNNLGIVAMTQGDYPKAHALYEESLAVAQQSGDKVSIAHAVGNLGLIAANRQDYQQARILYEESLRLGRELGIGGVSRSPSTDWVMWRYRRGTIRWPARCVRRVWRSGRK